MWSKILVLALVCLTPFEVQALDPDRRISQYAHTAWRVRDGAFGAAPTAITQTADGYMWIGTHAGLVRFDGVRFVTWAPPNGKHLPHPSVISLLGATDGSLWIGTAAGLAQWKNGDLINYSDTVGRVNSIYEDPEGAIWMTRSRTTAGGVCKVVASVARCYGPQDGVPAAIAGPLTGDNRGFLWIGETTALIRWKPGYVSRHEVAGLKSSAGLNGVNALVVAPDGSVWAGFSQAGHGLGLQQWVNSGWKTLITPTFDSSTLNVNGLWLDRDNVLWITTEGAGIYRIHDGKVDRFRSADGLSSDSVGMPFRDREGNLWLTTPEGIDCFRDTPIVNFTTREGLTTDDVDSVLAARDGTVWIGNRAGLDYLRGDAVSSIGPKNGLPGNRVTSLFEDRAGRLWVGLDNGLFVYERGKFRPIRPVGSGIVIGMAQDVDGNLWAIVIDAHAGKASRRVVQIRDERYVTEISDQTLGPTSLGDDPQGGLWLGTDTGRLARYRNGRLQIFNLKNANAKVYQLFISPDGSVLAATTGGLVEWRDEIQQTLNERNGLPCSRIYAIIADKHSNLWLYAECGLILIKSGDLQRWWEHPDTNVEFALFDASDGAEPFLPPFRPVATRSNDGRLWFANESVVQMINPDRLFRNSIPPPVHIENVIADRKEYSARSGLHLPALTRDLEIDYTAPSFVMPSRVQFRYKLEDYDRDWQDPKTRRGAFYSNLRPGNYKFHVMASNNAGVWNETGATLEFNIAPAWYQTTVFRVSCLLAGLLLLWLIYHLRMEQASRSLRARFAERMAERTRLARDLHDTLLQTLQGSKLVADDALENSSDPEHTRRSLEKLSEWIDRAMREGRAALNSLHSGASDNRELSKRLQSALDERDPNGVSEGFLTISGTPVEMNSIITDEICRVGYEAIRNAFMHSCATRIEVQLAYSEDFTLIVRDNGRGMDSATASRGRDGHYGLQSMRERAARIHGQFQLITAPNLGTTIELKIVGKTAFGQAAGDRSKLLFWMRGTRRPEV